MYNNINVEILNKFNNSGTWKKKNIIVTKQIIHTNTNEHERIKKNQGFLEGLFNFYLTMVI